MRINEAARAGRQRFGTWVTARLDAVKGAERSAAECAQACRALASEGAAVALMMRLAPEDALGALRVHGRRALDGMVRASRRLLFCLVGHLPAQPSIRGGGRGDMREKARDVQ